MSVAGMVEVSFCFKGFHAGDSWRLNIFLICWELPSIDRLFHFMFLPFIYFLWFLEREAWDTMGAKVQLWIYGWFNPFLAGDIHLQCHWITIHSPFPAPSTRWFALSEALLRHRAERRSATTVLRLQLDPAEAFQLQVGGFFSKTLR